MALKIEIFVVCFFYTCLDIYFFNNFLTPKNKKIVFYIGYFFRWVFSAATMLFLDFVDLRKIILSIIFSILISLFLYEGKVLKKLATVVVACCIKGSINFVLSLVVVFAKIGREQAITRGIIYLDFLCSLLICYYLVIWLRKKKTEKLEKHQLMLIISAGASLMCVYYFIFEIVQVYEFSYNNLIWALFIICKLAFIGFSINIFVDKIGKEKQELFIKQQLFLQNEQLKRIEEITAEIKNIKENYNSNIAKIQALFKEKRLEEFDAYVEGCINEINALESIAFCNNVVIDSILYNKKRYAEKNNIKMGISVINNFKTIISDIDLASLVFNLLDNAIEACVRDNKSHVKIRIYKDLKNIYFFTENYCEPPSENTKKKDKTNHGLGLKIIKDIVAKYDGKDYFEYVDGEFIHIISFNLKRVGFEEVNS